MRNSVYIVSTSMVTKSQSEVSLWCSGYHVCLTRTRSPVQSRAKTFFPLFFFSFFKFFPPLVDCRYSSLSLSSASFYEWFIYIRQLVVKHHHGNKHLLSNQSSHKLLCIFLSQSVIQQQIQMPNTIGVQ